MSVVVVKSSAKGIRIEALVADGAFPAQGRKERLDGIEVMARSCSQIEGDCPAASVYHGSQLGVEPAFGASNRFASLAAARVRTVVFVKFCKSGWVVW